MYEMLVSAILFYCKLTKALLSCRFELNPHDLCVANKKVNSEQLTICWHVDDLKSSHINPKVNDEFLQWIKDTFGQLGEAKMTQGPLHDYLGMTLDYSVPGQVSINVSHYVKKMVKEFPQENFKGASVTSPWNENLSKVQNDSAPLEKEQAELFHTVTAQGLQAWSSRYCTSNSLPNYMGTKTKSHRLDQAMLNDVISQANSEGQISIKSRWLWMP